MSRCLDRNVITGTYTRVFKNIPRMDPRNDLKDVSRIDSGNDLEKVLAVTGILVLKFFGPENFGPGDQDFLWKMWSAS